MLIPEKKAKRIINKATTLQREYRTLTEIRELGKEAGIDKAFIEQAIKDELEPSKIEVLAAKTLVSTVKAGKWVWRKSHFCIIPVPLYYAYTQDVPQQLYPVLLLATFVSTSIAVFLGEVRKGSGI